MQIPGERVDRTSSDDVGHDERISGEIMSKAQRLEQNSRSALYIETQQSNTDIDTQQWALIIQSLNSM